MRTYLLLLLLLSILGTCASAQAPVLPYTDLRVSAGQARFPVTSYFSITCYSLWVGSTQQVTRVGTTVTLSLPIVNNPGGVPCADPPVRYPASISIGQFEAGEYTFVLQPIAPVPSQPGVDYSPISTPFTVLPVVDLPLYFDLRVLPTAPIAGQLVTARIAARDFFAACFDQTPADIQRRGNTITLRLYESDTQGCLVGVPPPINEFDVPIGRFPPGDYILRVESVLDVSGGTPIAPLVAAFTVSGSAVSVPLASPPALVLMILGLLLLPILHASRHAEGSTRVLRIRQRLLRAFGA